MYCCVLTARNDNTAASFFSIDRREHPLIKLMILMLVFPIAFLQINGEIASRPPTTPPGGWGGAQANTRNNTKR